MRNKPRKHLAHTFSRFAFYLLLSHPHHFARLTLSHSAFFQFRLYDYDAAYAFHLWDAVAFFDHMEHYTTGATEADYQFRDDIQRLVINFVRENNKEMWQSFPNQTANVCNNVTLIVDYAKSAKCQFWESNGFAKYAWIT